MALRPSPPPSTANLQASLDRSGAPQTGKNEANKPEDEQYLYDTDEEIIELDEEKEPLDDESEYDENPEFYANLAETLPEAYLKSLATELIELIEGDREARKKRDDQYKEGLQRSGLGNDAPGGADFDGASRVVHPMITKACIDFTSRVMKEIFPAAGPVKDKIIGEPTREKIEKANRKVRHMNWQCTEQMREFRAELEQLVTQVPMGGASYMKLYHDATYNRPRPLFIPIDEMILPFAASSFYTADRRTHVQYQTELEFRRNVASGLYRDATYDSHPDTPEYSQSSLANDKIEGRDDNGENEDGIRTIYEMYALRSLPDDPEVDDDRPCPYIITIDEASSNITSIYRNWAQDDVYRNELDSIIEFPFVPWRGAYPIGLPHIIGNLSGAATGALRALLDSAHIQNMPALLKLKTTGTRGGQSSEINPTGVNEIEGNPLGSNDIRQLAMPIPYSPPNATLFQLLGFLVESGENVVRTTYADLADASTETPVGTTMARLEQGMTIFSAIHARMHDSMGRLLKVLHRLNATYIDDEEIKSETGELLARKSDYEGPMDVVPVSDPNIFSETQRYAQMQAVLQRSTGNPLYDPRKVEELFLRTMKIPNGDDLLVKVPKPDVMNPVNENVAASMGRPISPVPLQNHLAHLKVHMDFMLNPLLGSNPVNIPVFMPTMLQHIKDHLSMYYLQAMFAQISEMTGQPADTLMSDNPVVAAQFDQLLADSSTEVMQAMMGEQSGLMQVPDIVKQAQELLKQYQMPTPMDPSAVAMQQVQMEREVARDKLAIEQAKQQTAIDRLEFELHKFNTEHQRTLQEMQLKAQFEAQNNATELQAKQIESQTRLETNTDDNETAMAIAAGEIASGERVKIQSGETINPGA